MDIGLNPETQYITLKVQKEIFDTVKNFLGNNVLWTYDEEKKEIIIFKKPESYHSSVNRNRFKNLGECRCRRGY